MIQPQHDLASQNMDRPYHNQISHHTNLPWPTVPIKSHHIKAPYRSSAELDGATPSGDLAKLTPALPLLYSVFLKKTEKLLIKMVQLFSY